MKNTTALCNTCYKEIPAVADPFGKGSRHDAVPMLYKICPEHGIQRGVLEHDRTFYEQFSTYERVNHYNVLIINVTDSCNIKCKHCFYPIKNKWHMGLEEFQQLVTIWKAKGITQFIISGGDPTVWQHYFPAAAWCREHGVFLSQLTNGVRFADPLFWDEVKKHFVYNINGQPCLGAEISVHPANISPPGVRETQLRVLQKIREAGLVMSCIMINVDDTDANHNSPDLDNVMAGIVDFMQEWKDITAAFRIRSICFDAWGSTRLGKKWMLSELVRSLWIVTAVKGIPMEYSFQKDVDNIYNQNFKIGDMQVVTVCAANIEALDLGYLNRGPFMLANDGRAYSVPHAIIINEGLDKGYYGGCKC